MKFLNKKVLMGATLVLAFGFAFPLNAQHAWENYHWARTANPFTLELGDNVSNDWDAYLQVVSDDWSLSSVLNTVVKSGNTNGRHCRPTNGRVEVCNHAYGENGWLGLTQVYLAGPDHIVASTVKMNQTYFNLAQYDTPEFRRHAICHEVGHTFGLGHQDEDFFNQNLGSCLDYTANPASNQRPNFEDYQTLEAIYAHLDDFDSVLTSSEDGGGKGNGKGGNDGGNGGGKGNNGGGKKLSAGLNIDLSDPSAWGQAVSQDAQGKNSIFVRELGDGQKVITYVTWVK